jgi:GntR family transcriptional regulator
MAREDASRTAIRMALNLLRSEGLITRLQGIGTVAVRQSQVRVPLDPPRSVVNICGRGTERVCYVGLSVLATVVSSSVAERLEIASGEKVVFIERLTLIDHEPVSLASVWIPMAFAAPVLADEVDLQQGIFDILEQGLGLQLGDSEYSMEATAADEAVGSLLDVPIGSPLILLGTLTRLRDGRPAALGYTRGRADRVRYEFRASRDQHVSGASPSLACRHRAER